MGIGEDALKARNLKIKENGRATRERRKGQATGVVTLKVDRVKLTDAQVEAIEGQFREARWVYNEAVSSGDVFKYKPGRTVMVRLPDGSMERRDVRFLSAQEAQSIVELARNAVRGLSVMKSRGRRVGALKHVREVNAIPLKQYGRTYELRDPSGVRGDGIRPYVRVEKVPGLMHVTGAGQLAAWDEVGPATLIRKGLGDYRLAVTVFMDKDRREAEREARRAAWEDAAPVLYRVGGVDAGLENAITESDGTRSGRIGIPEPAKLGHWQARLAKHKDAKGADGRGHSRSWWEAKERVDAIYDEVARARDARALEEYQRLTVKYSVLFVQDEQIASWARRDGFVRGGRTIHKGIIGRLWALFRREANEAARMGRPSRVIVIDRCQPTTSWCYKCGRRTKHRPGLRVFHCAWCGFEEDRDVHAARNMVVLGLYPVTMEELRGDRSVPIGVYADLDTTEGAELSGVLDQLGWE
ncbi:hypothetical protein EMO89_00155 [Bifidobacterium tissieri]|uniref:Cas12f1-like TNB domain-containing protein n=1 Tax=Bifidobacterium tissieri TaxID=1630162 RepID=A0A5M9ZWI6_9BIFI|nr:zinc ribbon domain-containing protein [Bifidobacterium tissieri]KAA8831976.1 hypothetical protein EMO89_00155 [Bifidobacterium tissieri]